MHRPRPSRLLIRGRPVLSVATALLLYASGCASDDVRVSTSFDPLTRFPATATFAWDDAASSLPDDPRIQELDLGPLVREVANQEFAARGYRVGSPAAANYRLSYQVTVHTWSGVESRSIASLSLQLVEAASERRVWTGFGEADLFVGLTREERRERLRTGLARMLERFPPSQRGD